MKEKNKYIHIPCTQQEISALKKEAEENGYSTMAQYCRFIRSEYERLKKETKENETLA